MFETIAMRVCTPLTETPLGRLGAASATRGTRSSPGWGKIWFQRSSHRYSNIFVESFISSEVNASDHATLIETLVNSSPKEALEELEKYELEKLMRISFATREQLPRSGVITFSPKAFIPLTRLCRDSCQYCTFVMEPQEGRKIYMSVDEVLEVAHLGQSQGCTEALLTLGDKPELKYPQAAEELKSLGYQSTVEYVKVCAGAILDNTRLIPHINAGILTESELIELRMVSGSMGLMLESTNPNLMEPGMPHHLCPDKDPRKRLEVLDLAGKHQIPFTTGLLVGIGDTRLDRIDGLLKIRDSHRRYGHIQEVIIQNFIPKINTGMGKLEASSLEEILFTVCACRLIMPYQNIQVPPNLLSDWKILIDAGVNDFGGISPGVTPDFVNPEKPWPSIVALSKSVAESNKILLPRLPIYPEYVDCQESQVQWISSYGQSSPMRSVLNMIDGNGYVRGTEWYAGMKSDEKVKPHFELEEQIHTDGKSQGNKVPAIPKMKIKKNAVSISIDRSGSIQGCHLPDSSFVKENLIERSFTDDGFSIPEIVSLFSARGKDFETVVNAADEVRQLMNGDEVSYVINRNINYTNICEYGCKFCAFSKGSKDADLRGSPYLLSSEEISNRTIEAVEAGATEVCMQGGIHPSFTGEDYIRILSAAKAACPDVHVHAFSPLEISHGATTLGLSIIDYLGILRDAGLGSLPGTAAEILNERVRMSLCPDKLTSQEWIDIIMAAHSVGLKTTSTIMFGHIDTYLDWAEHLLTLRDIQKQTLGITEFVPLPFVHMEAPIYRKGYSRAGPTLHESILMHAVSRLVLNPFIPNIQASWVKMGPEKASELLKAGCNDMGGTLMNESITRAAGAQFGQLQTEEEMVTLISKAGRMAYQRSTLYNKISIN